MSLIVIGVTLAMALLQASGVAGGLEEVSGFVAEPGSHFRAVAIATMIAGTALAMIFVSLIDRAGLGCGLWLLLLAPALAALPSTLAGLAVLSWRGEYSAEMLVLAGVYSAIAIAGVVSIVLAARAAAPTVATCVWTPFLANAVITPLLFMLGWLATLSIDDAVRFATTTSVIWYLAPALIVAAIVWLYVRSYAGAGQEARYRRRPSPAPWRRSSSRRRS